MTTTLGRSKIELYGTIASNILPITEVNRLIEDLKTDPFIDHALNGLMCEIYHRFGAILAQVSLALLPAKHCDLSNKHTGFKHTCPLSIPQQENEFEFRGDVNSTRATDATTGATDATTRSTTSSSVTDNESNE